MGVAGNPTGAQKCEHSARQQDGDDQPRAPRSAGEATGGHCPAHQGEAQKRDGKDVHHHAHPRIRDGLVDERLCREHRDDHQDDGAYAFGPGRSAEEQPPHEDSQPADEPANHPEHHCVRSDEGDDKPDQPLQDYGDHAGPQPERFPRSRFVDTISHCSFSL